MINFPDNPAAQVPTNTFSPSSTPLASPNGIAYVWDGTKWASPPLPVAAGMVIFPTLSASGASVDYTDIPSWATRITLSLYRVGTNGSSRVAMLLGTASGFETSGYDSVGGNLNGESTSTNSIPINDHMTSSFRLKGQSVLTKLDGNTWISSGICGSVGPNYGASSKTLSGVLTQIRLTTQGGTDVFNAGNFSLLCEC